MTPGPKSSAYRTARGFTKLLFVAVLVAGIVMAALCGGGGGPDPSGTEISEEDLYAAMTLCLPWIPLALPTVVAGALALRGPAGADRSGWFVATWAVFLATPLFVAVMLGQVFPAMVALWVTGAAGLMVSIFLVRTSRPKPVRRPKSPSRI